MLALLGGIYQLVFDLLPPVFCIDLGSYIRKLELTCDAVVYRQSFVKGWHPLRSLVLGHTIRIRPCDQRGAAFLPIVKGHHALLSVRLFQGCDLVTHPSDEILVHFQL